MKTAFCTICLLLSAFAFAQSDTLKKDTLLKEPPVKRFASEVSFIPLDLLLKPCYDYEDRALVAVNMRGGQLKLLFKQKNVLRASILMIKNLYATKTGSQLRVGYERTLINRKNIRLYAFTDLAYQITSQRAAKFYHNEWYTPSFSAKEVYDSTFQISQTARSYGILAGIGIKLSEPSGWFIGAESGGGLCYFIENVHSHNITTLKETRGGVTNITSYKDYGALDLTYTGYAAMASALRISFGLMF